MQENNKSVDILKLDILQFFRKVTHYKPTQFQSELLLSFLDPNISQICVVAGRQTGKTLTCAVAVVYLSIHGKHNILLTSAQDNNLYEHIRDIFTNCPELREFITFEGTYSIVPLKGYETTSGSRVQVKGSTEKNIRGVFCNIAVCDEAELLSDDILGTILGTLSGNYKFVLLGTPPRERKGFFYNVILTPRETGYILFKWSAEDCSWHLKKDLENKKKLLGQWYKPEVQGEILEEAERGIFSNKDLDACIVDVVYPEGGTKEIGIDWASGHRCFTVLTCLERTKSAHVKVLFTRRWTTEQMSNIFTDIAEILQEQKPDRIKVDGLPAGYVTDLKSVYKGRTIYPVKFGDYYQGATHKERMLGQLIHKVQTHQLVISATEVELIRQMRIYKRGKQYSDDYVDSLMLAVYYEPDLFKPATGGIVIFPRDYEKRNREALHEW